MSSAVLTLCQIRDKSVHSNIPKSAAEKKCLNCLFAKLIDRWQHQEESAKPDLVSRDRLGQAILLQHQVGLVLQNLHLQVLLQVQYLRLEQNQGFQARVLRVVEPQLADPRYHLAQLSYLIRQLLLLIKGGEGVPQQLLLVQVHGPLRQGEDEQLGPGALKQKLLVTTSKLLEGGD